MGLITRCPNCSTRFKVVPDQIRIAAGWVRCGHCGEVFDASAHLLPRAAGTGSALAESPVMAGVDKAPLPTPAEPTVASPALPDAAPVNAPAPPKDERPQAPIVAPTPEDVAPHKPEFSAAREHPTAPAAALGTTTTTGPQGTLASPLATESVSALPEPPESDFGNAQPADATTPMTLAGAATEGLGTLPDHLSTSDEDGASATPSFVAAARRRALWQSPPVRKFLWLAGALLLIVLPVQWAIGQRDWLAARAPRMAPLLSALCAPLNCRVQPYRQLSAIVIDSSAFNRVAGNQFRFSVNLRNVEAYAVASPALQLTLTDRDNQPLLQRVLPPAELGAPIALAAGGEFNVSQNMAVAPPVDPAAVTGYRLTAFYP